MEIFAIEDNWLKDFLKVIKKLKINGKKRKRKSRGNQG